MQEGSRISAAAEKQVKQHFYDMSIGILSHLEGTNRKVTLAQFWTLFMSLQYANEKGVSLASTSDSRKLFVESVIRRCDNMMDEAKVNRSVEIQEYHYKGRLGTIKRADRKPSKAHFFDGWISAFHYANQRVQAYREIIRYLESELFQNETVFAQLDPETPPPLKEVA